MKLNFFGRMIKNTFKRKFIKSILFEYNRRIPKSSLLLELSKESVPGISINELGQRCTAIYNSMKSNQNHLFKTNKSIKSMKST